MTDEVKQRLRDLRNRQRAERARKDAALAADNSHSTWRKDVLDRYVTQVLKRSGRERLEFFAAHPIGGIFQ